MMKLSQLLEQIEYTCVQGGLDKEIKSVVYDSRKVTPDSLFLCRAVFSPEKRQRHHL